MSAPRPNPPAMSDDRPDLPPADFTFDDVLGDLRQFRDDLHERPESVQEKYTCRRFVMELEPRQYGPAEVKAARRILGVSQPIFAQFLGMSVSAVRSWERGENAPEGGACRLMDEITASPDHFKERLRSMMKPKPKIEPEPAGC